MGLIRILIFLGLFFFSFESKSQLKIYEVFAGGGNTGAPYVSDYVVLYNAGITPINLSGYSVQYNTASSMASTWNVVPLSGSIPAKGFFLVRMYTNPTNVGMALPPPDITASPAVNMAVAGAKVALMNTTTALSTQTPVGNPALQDFIGWGSANAAEGTVDDALTNILAAARDNNATDTNNNQTDFISQSPNPRNSSSSPLPVTYKSISAKSLEKNTIVSWETAQETNSSHFEIERSGDAVEFYAVGKLAAAGESFEGRIYNFTDNQPLNGLNYYRLKQVDVDGAFEYSRIVVTDFGADAVSFEVLGNPVVNQRIQVFARNISAENINLFSTNGNKVDFEMIETRPFTFEIKPKTALSSGLYFLNTIQRNKVLTQKILID
jgi:hypothetical protein